jgi:hypothetical protein
MCLVTTLLNPHSEGYQVLLKFTYSVNYIILKNILALILLQETCRTLHLFRVILRTSAGVGVARSV